MIRFYLITFKQYLIQLRCSLFRLPNTWGRIFNLHKIDSVYYIVVNYKDALIPLEGKLNESDNSDSGNDTDDLIEDARDFVRIGQR